MPLASRLNTLIAQLGERYGGVLPREAVAEIVRAAARTVLADTPAGSTPELVAARVAARASADLAIAVGAPTKAAAYTSVSGLATAWTHLLDGVAVVRAVGEFDMRSDRVLTRELAVALASGRRAILVDLGRVSYMDAAGLAPLIVAARAARRTGQRLLLVQVPGHVSHLIEMAGVGGEFGAARGATGPGQATRARRAG